jgi:magnesium transporter
VIAGMQAEDAAALFETLPIRVVAPIVEHMEKWPAARCLQHMSLENAAAILGEVSYQNATVLLRLTPPERRDAIYQKLPSRLARDLKTSLRYPRNCVGAWMDLSVPTLSLGATVKNAVAIARAGQATGTIFVVDDDQRLGGLARAETLLGYPAGTRISDIMQTAPRPLFARMLLREAESETAWNDFLLLPVVGRNGQLLGALSRRGMVDGLAATVARSSVPDAGATVWTQIGEAFVASLAGLVGLFDGNAAGIGRHTET